MLAAADALVADLPDGASVDLQSLAATYRARTADGDERGRAAFARAVVRRAAREDIVAAGDDPRTVAELRDEIKARNEGRDDAAKIRPAGAKRADLLDALAADDDG